MKPLFIKILAGQIFYWAVALPVLIWAPHYILLVALLWSLPAGFIGGFFPIEKMNKYDRPKFMKFLKGFIEQNNVKVVKDIPDDAKIVVTRVKDFDPESNSVWLIDANKSYSREGLGCGKCGDPVVMSNGAYERYLKNPKPENIICNKCLFGI